MKCNNCGRENADFHKYCIECGAPLEAPAKPRRRMGFFPRVIVQIVILLVAIGALVYWLGTLNLVGAYKNSSGGYVAYSVFVGRERLYTPDKGGDDFSEAKVADTFAEGTRRIDVRLDTYHYGLGAKSLQLKIIVKKHDDESWAPHVVLIDLPRNGCTLDRDVGLIENRALTPGRYDVRFYVVQAVEEPKDVHFKSIHFTVAESNK